MTPRRYTREWALQKLQEYLNKRRCCDAAGEMDTKFLEQICKKPETRAVSQMDPDSICTTFGLSREPEDSGFVPASLDCYDLPSELLNQMDWVREALGVSPGNETECRMRLAAIITHCLRAERAWLAQQEVKPPNQLNLTLETSISVTVNESVTPFTVCGKVDYALWYNVKELRSSLFILEAKASDTMSTTGKFQCLAYMCMIQAIRKRHGHKNTIIYGVLSDGFEFVFLCLDNDGRWSQWTPNHPWYRRDSQSASQIYTLIRLIIRNSITFSPRSSPLKKVKRVKRRSLLSNPIEYHIRHRSSEAEDAIMDTESDCD